jgi:hypothetical protein
MTAKPRDWPATVRLGGIRRRKRESGGRHRPMFVRVKVTTLPDSTSRYRFTGDPPRLDAVALAAPKPDRASCCTFFQKSGRDASRLWRWNENVEFVPNSHDFHRHPHLTTKSETWRALHDYLQPSRVRQKINSIWSARRVGRRCVSPVLTIEQPDQKPKCLGLPAQLANHLLF